MVSFNNDNLKFHVCLKKKRRLIRKKDPLGMLKTTLYFIIFKNYFDDTFQLSSWCSLNYKNDTQHVMFKQSFLHT